MSLFAQLSYECPIIVLLTLDWRCRQQERGKGS